MVSFKNIMIRNIGRKTFEKEYYEECIANWAIHGWLKDDEVTACLDALEKDFPAEAVKED